MKTKVWKMLFIVDENDHEEWTPKETYYQTEVLGEKDWTARLKQAIADEQLNHSTMVEYDLLGITDDKTESMTAEQIIDIFEFDGYMIDESTIEIGE